jgi:GntR family transcriptional regulator
MVSPLKLENDSLSARAREYLISLINSGVYEPGQKLPSQVELASQLGISRGTLREALHDLEREGVVFARHGVGTFVASSCQQRIEGGLERMESILKLASQQDLTPTYRELEVEELPVEGDLADRLGVAVGSLATFVRRTIVIDHQAVAYMEDVAPVSVLTPRDVDSSFTGSVLDLLVEKMGLDEAWAVSEISAVTATDFLVERFELDAPASLLLLEETLHHGDGSVLSFSRNYFVSEHFRFRVVRR